jgi:hypothetical protein
MEPVGVARSLFYNADAVRVAKSFCSSSVVPDTKEIVALNYEIGRVAVVLDEGGSQQHAPIPVRPCQSQRIVLLGAADIYDGTVWPRQELHQWLMQLVFIGAEQLGAISPSPRGDAAAIFIPANGPAVTVLHVSL